MKTAGAFLISSRRPSPFPTIYRCCPTRNGTTAVNVTPKPSATSFWTITGLRWYGTKPDAGLRRIRRFWGALTPDFSLYVDWPLAVQQWNHYRRQWLGRYGQEHGIKVIPTVNWSTPDSYGWCFEGILPGQIVALAVPDLRHRLTRRYFITGFGAMIETLNPARLRVYGRLPFAVDIPCTEVQPDWIRLRK